MAAAALWVLDASINVSMEPFRAFVADLLPEGQRTLGFAMQSIFHRAGGGGGLRAAVGAGERVSCAAGGGGPHTVPTTVRLSFYIGAAVFFLRCCGQW